jgi:hypothetical protein
MEDFPDFETWKKYYACISEIISDRYCSAWN